MNRVSQSARTHKKREGTTLCSPPPQNSLSDGVNTLDVNSRPVHAASRPSRRASFAPRRFPPPPLPKSLRGKKKKKVRRERCKGWLNCVEIDFLRRTRLFYGAVAHLSLCKRYDDDPRPPITAFCPREPLRHLHVVIRRRRTSRGVERASDSARILFRFVRLPSKLLQVHHLK